MWDQVKQIINTPEKDKREEEMKNGNQIEKLKDANKLIEELQKTLREKNQLMMQIEEKLEKEREESELQLISVEEEKQMCDQKLIEIKEKYEESKKLLFEKLEIDEQIGVENWEEKIIEKFSLIIQKCEKSGEQENKLDSNSQEENLLLKKRIEETEKKLEEKQIEFEEFKKNFEEKEKILLKEISKKEENILVFERQLLNLQFQNKTQNEQINSLIEERRSLNQKTLVAPKIGNDLKSLKEEMQRWKEEGQRLKERNTFLENERLESGKKKNNQEEQSTLNQQKQEEIDSLNQFIKEKMQEFQNSKKEFQEKIEKLNHLINEKENERLRLAQNLEGLNSQLLFQSSLNQKKDQQIEKLKLDLNQTNEEKRKLESLQQQSQQDFQILFKKKLEAEETLENLKQKDKEERYKLLQQNKQFKEEVERLKTHLLEIEELNTESSLERSEELENLKKKEENTLQTFRAEMEKKEIIIQNLQKMLEENEMEKERDFELKKEEMQSNFKLQNNHLCNKLESLEIAFSNYREKTEKELEEKECNLKKQIQLYQNLEIKIEPLKEKLNQSLQKLSLFANNNNLSVDKRLCANLFTSYISEQNSTKKQDILNLIDRILGFDENQKILVGLIKRKNNWNFLSWYSKDNNPQSPTNDKTLTDMWIEYLLTETESQNKETSPNTNEQSEQK